MCIHSFLSLSLCFSSLSISHSNKEEKKHSDEVIDMVLVCLLISLEILLDLKFYKCILKTTDLCIVKLHLGRVYYCNAINHQFVGVLISPQAQMAVSLPSCV